MFCLRHYGQEAGGKRTTINYFSTRASAGAGAAVAGVSTASTGSGRASLDMNGNQGGAAGAVAEASTTTVRTVIHGPSTALGTNGDGVAVQDDAAALLEGFEGVALDARAEAEIGAALLALAERQRALVAAADEGGPEAIAAQIDDPGVGLVRLGEHGVPFYGPLQAYEGPADAEPVQRFAGEADWVSAGDDIPEGYREWIEAAEARGEAVPAVPLAPAIVDGVAAVKKRPSWRRARKGEGTGEAE